MLAWWNELRLQLLRWNTVLPNYFCLGEHAFSPDKRRDLAYWTFPRFVMPHVYRRQSWLVLNLMSLEIMKLSVHQLFRIYSCCPRETRQPGEGCTCCVLLSVLPQSNWEWLGIDFCVCVHPAWEKGVGCTGGEPFKPFRVPVLVVAAAPILLFFLPLHLHIAWHDSRFHLGEERLRHSWGSWAGIANIQKAQSFWGESENADIWGLCIGFGGFFGSYSGHIYFRIHKCEYSTKSTEVTPFKDSISCPVEVPNLWILLCVPLSFSVN